MLRIFLRFILYARVSERRSNQMLTVASYEKKIADIDIIKIISRKRYTANNE